MNVQATHVIPMLPVLTMKVLFSVNVILGIMELDLIVLVSKFFHSCMCLKYLTFFSSLVVCYLYSLFRY